MEKAVEIPEEIDNDFFEKNELGRRFYDFGECGNCLSIPGYDWRNNEAYDWKDKDETKLFKSFVQSKFLQDKIQDNKFKEWNIDISNVRPNNWQSLFCTFRKCNLPSKVNRLVLGDSREGSCKMTEEDVEILEWVLDSQQSGFQIGKLHLDVRMSESCCRKWIRGLSDMSILHSPKFKSVPSWFLLLYVQQTRPKDLDCSNYHYENGGEDDNQIKMEISISHSRETITETITETWHRIDFDVNNTRSTVLEAFRENLCSTHMKHLSVGFYFYDHVIESSANATGINDSDHVEQVLAWLVSLRQPRFHIQTFDFEFNSPNSYHKSVEITPSLILPHFIQHYRPQALSFGNKDYLNYHTELEAKVPDTNELDKTTVSNKIPFIENVEIYPNLKGEGSCNEYDNAEKYETWSMVESVLQNAHVGVLEISDIDDSAHDFFAGALGCREIYLQGGAASFYLPCDGLASMIHKDGYLKKLSIRGAIESSAGFNDITTDRFFELDKLLENTDLSFLDTFSIHEISEDDTIVFPALCRHLEENKAPRHFHIGIWKYYSEESSDESESESENEYCNFDKKGKATFEKLAKSLCGNTKIEHLTIYVTDTYISAPTLLQFIQRTVCNLPRLSWFELEFDEEYTYIEMEKEKEQKQIVLEAIRKNKNLKHLRLPFDDEGLELEIKYRDLLCRGNDISDGIWSHVLGRIDGVSTVGLVEIYNIVQQVPRLFQSQAKDDEKATQPMFTVPHHPNCPACRSNSELQANAKRARITE